MAEKQRRHRQPSDNTARVFHSTRFVFIGPSKTTCGTQRACDKYGGSFIERVAKDAKFSAIKFRARFGASSTYEKTYEENVAVARMIRSRPKETRASTAKL